jgi:hypothetical protein
MSYFLEFVGVGIDGVEGAEGIDKGGASVHGHGNAEGFGDFLFGGAGFEGGVSVEGDASVAAGGNGNGNGDELAGFFAEERGSGVGGGEGLIAFEGVWGELGEIGDGFGEFGLIGVPIKEHFFLLREMGAGREYSVFSEGIAHRIAGSRDQKTQRGEEI